MCTSTIKTAQSVVPCSISWRRCITSVIVIIFTNAAIHVQSFPLDAARDAWTRISPRCVWNRNPAFRPSSNSISRETTVLLKASRRDVVSRGDVLETLWVMLSTATSTILGFPHRALAADDESTMTSNESIRTPNIPHEQELVKGRITVAPNVDIGGDPNPNASLYITCRPDKIDSVPVALLNAYRGKAPPVLSVRLPIPATTTVTTTTFPIDFVLRFPTDITLEGAWDGKSPLSSPDGTALSIPTPTTIDEVWWNQVDLIVSVRWDSDGVAATRSPDDLVGRGLWKFNEKSQESLVHIQLTGRGAFGKFATGSSNGIKK